MIELVYSVDGSEYLRWQADLLDWSVRRVGMNCRITRLTAVDADCKVYGALNRLWALSEQWKESDCETVVLLDPDMVFFRPLEVTAKIGHVIGCPYSYIYDLAWCPMAIHRNQLREWAGKTLALSRVLHKNGVGWISDMWAGNICATQMKMQLQRRRMGMTNWDEKLADAALIHYCYDRAGFSKRNYRRAQRVECVGGNEVQRKLAEVINAYVGGSMVDKTISPV